MAFFLQAASSQALAGLLEKHSTLTSLDLTLFQFTKDDISRLASVLKENTSLRTLILKVCYDDKITHNYVQALANLFKNNSLIVSLDFEINLSKIDACIETLVSVLENNVSFRALILRDNFGVDEGVEALAAFLNKSNITRLEINHSRAVK